MKTPDLEEAIAVDATITKARRGKPQRWPFVTRRVDGSGAIAWVVDARTKAGGERRTFGSKTAAEIEKLDWSEIDLAAGVIEIKANKAKTSRNRSI
jgi:hypothetical protein